MPLSLAGGSPYLLSRVTLLGGLTFTIQKVEVLSPFVRAKFSISGTLAHPHRVQTWLDSNAC